MGSMQTMSREDYLKAILKLDGHAVPVSTNALADKLQSRPASVTNMVQKLSEAGWVNHEAYRGVMLTDAGRTIAMSTLRKHRLWEVFLVEKLGFKWDEVHDWAEQLEHVGGGGTLIDRLDAYLGHPAFDPHGDPIPTSEGEWKDVRDLEQLTECQLEQRVIVKGVMDSSDSFLQHLNALDMKLGLGLKVIHWFEFDQSMEVEFDSGKKCMLSRRTAERILVD